MARRKHSKPRQLDISFQGEKAPEAQPEKLHVFPFELRPGDRVTDPEGREWEVTDPQSPTDRTRWSRFGRTSQGSRAWPRRSTGPRMSGLRSGRHERSPAGARDARRSGAPQSPGHGGRGGSSHEVGSCGVPCLAASIIDGPRPPEPASATCFMRVPARLCWHLGCSAVKRDYADSSATACNGAGGDRAVVAARVTSMPKSSRSAETAARRLMASAADESASLHWWHFLIAALLLATSTVLIVYLT
jgi:hypothetical protein